MNTVFAAALVITFASGHIQVFTNSAPLASAEACQQALDVGKKRYNEYKAIFEGRYGPTVSVDGACTEAAKPTPLYSGRLVVKTADGGVREIPAGAQRIPLAECQAAVNEFKTVYESYKHMFAYVYGSELASIEGHCDEVK
jgi:hypothetical protein